MAKILVIEDEETIRANILDLLEAEGFEALGAANGRIGVELATQQIPDLILCDLVMPELDGHGVLKKLRTSLKTATIPFIFLTAKADRPALRQGMELGADDYLIKPCSLDELLKAITTRLAKKSALHQQYQKTMDDLRSSIAYSPPHELRTPLNGIMGFSELLITNLDVLEKTDIQDIAENIFLSSKRLNRLIQKFLIYTDLELSSTNPERIQTFQAYSTPSVEPILLEEVFREIQYYKREQDLQIDLQDSSVRMSENWLRTLIKEVIVNACKFSVTGTQICVASCLEANFFKITVGDQGRGMTPEQIAQIGAYQQFDRQVYEQQGIGLGLHIAKRLAELHGGSLIIDSIPGQQTTICIRLPIE